MDHAEASLLPSRHPMVASQPGSRISQIDRDIVIDTDGGAARRSDVMNHHDLESPHRGQGCWLGLMDDMRCAARVTACSLTVVLVAHELEFGSEHGQALSLLREWPVVFEGSIDAAMCSWSVGVPGLGGLRRQGLRRHPLPGGARDHVGPLSET